MPETEIENVPTNDPVHDVDVWLNAAISAIESCSNELESGAGNDAELSQRIEWFLKLCKNALVINKMLI